MILLAIRVVDQLTNCLVKIYLKRTLSPCFYFLMFMQSLIFFFLLVLIEVTFEATFLEVINTKHYCYVLSPLSFYDEVNGSQKGCFMQILSMNNGKQHWTLCG